MRIIRRRFSIGSLTRQTCLTAHRRAAVSLEFAILSVPFLILSLGTLELGYDMYVQAALDNAVENAARSVQVGATTGANKETSASLVAAAVCPALRDKLNCGQLIVGVAPLPSGDYFTAPPSSQTPPVGHFQISLGSSQSAGGAASAGGAVCTGTAGQLMLLQAWYIGPSFIGGLIPSFASTWYNAATSRNNLQHITESSAGFVNEFGIAGQSQGVGC